MFNVILVKDKIIELDFGNLIKVRLGFMEKFTRSHRDLEN